VLTGFSNSDSERRYGVRAHCFSHQKRVLRNMARRTLLTILAQDASHARRRPHWTCVLAILPMCAISAYSAADEDALLDAREVIRQIKPDMQSTGATASEAGALVKDIQQFRLSSDTQAPQQAAAVWFGLLDLASSAGSHANISDPASFDVPLRRPVGVGSVVAALPPPNAWPFLEAEADKRYARPVDDYRALSVQLLPAVLLGEHTATNSILTSLDAAIASLPPEQRLIPLSRVAVIRRALVKLYAMPSEVVAAFRADVAASGSPTSS
jgi:hypothetical protein